MYNYTSIKLAVKTEHLLTNLKKKTKRKKTPVHQQILHIILLLFVFLKKGKQKEKNKANNHKINKFPETIISFGFNKVSETHIGKLAFVKQTRI